MKKLLMPFFNEKGQTLLEILFALGVVVVVTGATVTSVTKSLGNSQYAKNQNLATSYAQEGIAVVRKVRDSTAYNFNFANTYCLGSDDEIGATAVGTTSDCAANTGIYARSVTFEPNSSDCSSGTGNGTKATVDVQWNDGKCPGTSLCHKVELTSCFFKSNQALAVVPVVTLAPTLTPTPTLAPSITPTPGVTPVPPQNCTISNTWVNRTNPTTISMSGTNFTINSKNYASIDSASGYQSEFWMYDPVTNWWTQKANIVFESPNAPSGSFSVGFSIGDKGYLGLGTYTYETGVEVYHKDFWEYNHLANTWTRKNDFPGRASRGAVSFALNGKGYVGLGRIGVTGNYVRELWEYNPSTDTWTEKKDVGGTQSNGNTGILRAGASGFSIGTYGYIGLGAQINPDQKTLSGSLSNDLRQYNPGSDTWTTKANAPGARMNATAFSDGSTKAYVGGGFSSLVNGIPSEPLNNFWEYNPSVGVGGTWTFNKTTFGGWTRAKAGGFFIDGKGYMGGGVSGGIITDLWQYCP